MNSKFKDSNKQFLAVIVFFIFIIVSILGLVFYQDKSNVKKEKNSNNITCRHSRRHCPAQR